jgi:hypothetical protein
MSNPESNPCRASRFIEDMPDPLRPQTSSDLLFSILSQMDEFEQKRKHRASHSSADSWGSSREGRDGVSKGNNAGWLKSVKGMGIKDKLRGLVKTSGT